MEQNSYFIPLLLQHIKLMGINCNPKELQLVLQSAPSFPSVLSIVQTYTYFGLKATAYRADYTALEKASIPALAHIRQGETDRFILIYNASPTTVSYYDAFTNKKTIISIDQFCTIWTGVIILSEKTEKIVHNKRKRGFKAIATLAFISLIFLCFVINSTPQPFIFIYGLLGLKLIGIWSTLGLLLQELRGSYSVFDTFCYKNKAFDCEKVIQSKASKLFKKIALTDVGFVYFVTGIQSLCIGTFSGNTIPILQTLLYLSICSIPFVLFSIFYQKIIIGKWCPLCLSIIFILVAEMIFFLFFPVKTFACAHILTVGILLFSLFSSLVILSITKYIIKNQAKAFNENLSALLIKRTPLIISAIFGSQRNISKHAKDSLLIGDKKAPITITTLLNPMCNPCRNLALTIIKLVESYPALIQWHIRLDGTIFPEYNHLNTPQLYLFELFRQNKDTEYRLEIIKKWFKEQNFLKFSKSYPLDNITEDVKSAFYNHMVYNKELKVEKVPSIWINNRIFPKEYLLRDIPFLLTDINTLLKSTT